MGNWQSIGYRDEDDTHENFVNQMAFEDGDKYNLMSPFSNDGNGYLKADQSGQVLLANGMAGTNNDADQCKWIAKEVKVLKNHYWKFWTNDSKKEIVVTSNDKVELKDVNPSPHFLQNQFLPAHVNNNKSQVTYNILQPREKVNEKKFLGVNRDGTMTLITNRSLIKTGVGREKYFNVNPQQLFMVFKVEEG